MSKCGREQKRVMRIVVSAKRKELAGWRGGGGGAGWQFTVEWLIK